VLDEPLDRWEKRHLDFLVDNELEETHRLEYKRGLTLETRAQKQEAAKDVSAFSNTAGGKLIIGITEEERESGARVPKGYEPIEDGGLPERLEDVLLHYCQPNVNYVPKRIPIDGDKYCLVLEIAMSPGPVMVIGASENRYYKRVNQKTVPMQEHEIQAAYNRLSRARDLVEELIENATPLVKMEQADWERLPQGGEDGFHEHPGWLTLLTAPLFPPGELFDPIALNQRRLVDFSNERESDLLNHMQPLSPTAFGAESRLNPEYPYDLFRVHRNGVLEFHRMIARTSPMGKPMPVSVFWPQPEYRYMLDALRTFAGLYLEAGYYGPLTVRGVYTLMQGYDLPSQYRGARALDAEPSGFATDSSVEALARDAPEIARAIIDRVWQAGGHPRCPWFTSEGEVIHAH
jgi:hypothetical protein